VSVNPPLLPSLLLKLADHPHQMLEILADRTLLAGIVSSCMSWTSHQAALGSSHALFHRGAITSAAFRNTQVAQ